MNKLDFLRRLDRELSVLDKEERREILRFYEERFYNGTIYENKTEEEVIAELERPDVIARNVLEEYGVSPKFVKTKEERYTNVSTFKAVLLIAFDVLVATSVIPALFTAAVAILGSCVSWVATLGLVLGESSAVDQYVFGLTTSVYILLFVFGLLVLEVALWFTRTLIKWHLNVFKVKNREKTIKKLSHWSLESYFKKHRRARRLKNFATFAAIIGVIYTGLWINNHFDWVTAEYSSGDIQDTVLTEDFTQELANEDQWTIETDMENIDIEIVVISGTDFVVKHSYYEDDKFTYDFNYDTNVVTLSNDTENEINFFFDPVELFKLFNEEEVLRIEVPADLVLEDVMLKTTNSPVEVRNVDFKNLDVITSNASVEVINTNVSNNAYVKSSNGRVTVSNATIAGYLKANTTNNAINVSDVTVGTDLELTSSNGKITVDAVTGSTESDLIASTTNNRIRLNNVSFDNYALDTSNGEVSLYGLNTTLQDGGYLTVTTTNNAINAEEVYCDVINMETSNGDIDLENTDTSFHPTTLDLETSSYNDVTTNVTD